MEAAPPQAFTDHDLLVTLSADMRNLTQNVQQLGLTVEGQVADHETRIRANEKDVEQLKVSTKTSQDSTKRIAMWLGAFGAIAGPVVAICIVVFGHK